MSEPEAPLLASARPQANVPEFSVVGISAAIKGLLEKGFAHVRVRGEISGLKRQASGHIYLDLKENTHCLAGVIWKSTAGRLRVQPQNGLEVVAVGRITSFSGSSKYQIAIERLELAGLGALMQLLEARRKQLAAEGLFDEARKKPIPYLPEVIGVVTSPTGAVIRDILHRLSERFPRRVLVWPVAVQGERAAAEIAAAISGFDALPRAGTVPRPDVLIVARGGGSVEDLMAFNEEVVVRAAAACSIPLISAIGHETDTTLIDFAADRRAPTPTAAAEMAVPVRAELRANVSGLAGRLQSSLDRRLQWTRQRLVDLARGLPRRERLLESPRQRLDHFSEKMSRSLKHFVQRQRPRLERAAAGLAPAPLLRAIETRRERGRALAHRLGQSVKSMLERQTGALASKAGLLESLSFRATLARGFAMVESPGKGLVRRASGIRPGDRLQITFADGAVPAEASGTPSSGAKPASPRGKSKPPGQADLF